MAIFGFWCFWRWLNNFRVYFTIIRARILSVKSVDEKLTCKWLFVLWCLDGVWLLLPLLVTDDGESLPSLSGRALLCVNELGNVLLISCEVDRDLALLDRLVDDGLGDVLLFITWPVDRRSTLMQPYNIKFKFFLNQSVLKEIKSNQAVQRICDWTGLIIKSAISKRYKRHFMRIWWIISINQVFVFSMNIWLITCLLFYCIFSCSSVFMHGKNTSVSFSNESEFFGLRFGFVA